MICVVLLIIAVILCAYAVQYSKEKAMISVTSQYSDNNRYRGLYAPLFFSIVTVLLIVFSAFRKSYNDTFFYIYAFDLLDTTLNEYIKKGISFNDYPLFNILQIFIKQYISTDASYLVFIATSVPMTLLMLFFYKKSEHFGDCVFLFLSMGLMFFSMGAMKQFIAIGFGVWSIHFASQKKWFKFALIILIAMLFHQYAFVYLAVLLFLKDDIWSWKSVMMLMLVLAIGFSFGTFAKGLLESTEDISGGGYDMTYMEEGVSIIRVLVYAVPSMLSLACRKYINENAPQFIKICINLGIITFLMLVLAFFGGAIVFTRFAYYFEPFMYIGFAWVITNCFEGYYKTALRFVYFPAFVFYFMYNNFIHMSFNFRSLIEIFNTY